MTDHTDRATDPESTWQPAYPAVRAGEERNGTAAATATAAGSAADDGANAGPRTPARARERGRRVWDALTVPVERGYADRRDRMTDEEKAAPEVVRQSFWEEGPASIRDIIEYTKSGAWAPGEQDRWIELAGKAYGYLVAVPVTALLYFLAFWLQRPQRFVIAVGIVAALLIPNLIGWAVDSAAMTPAAPVKVSTR